MEEIDEFERVQQEKIDRMSDGDPLKYQAQAELNRRVAEFRQIDQRGLME